MANTTVIEGVPCGVTETIIGDGGSGCVEQVPVGEGFL